MKKRLEWLDIAKGIGILLVIFSHCLHIDGKLFHLVFTFHMPLFLMLSGYVYSGRESFGELAKKKARTLLVPFCGFFLLGLTVSLILPEWRQGLSLQEIWDDIWLADPNAVHNSSIWYLVCLFFVVLLFHGIQKLSVGGRFLCLLSLYTAGMWYSRNRFPLLGYTRLPLNLDVLPVAIVFFALGYYARFSGVMESITRKRGTALLSAAAGTFGVCLVYRCNGYVNLHGLNFGWPDFYLLGGLCGTLAVVGASVLLEQIAVPGAALVRKILVWYGRNSLNVLGLQSLLIRLYIVGMSRVFGIELSLYHFSWKHTFVATALVAFAACPPLCWGIDRLKDFVTRRKRKIVKV